MSKFLRIIEILWAVVAVVAAATAISRAVSGQEWGSYLYVTLFTGTLAVFMYFFKKRNRKYMEEYYRKQQEEART
jgi:peptidoglycan/LPS O-acetylase OafA/YrhL